MIFLHFHHFSPRCNAKNSTDEGGHSHGQGATQSYAQRCAAQGRPAEITAKRPESRETHQRQPRNQGDAQRCRCDEQACNRNHGKERKARGGYPRRLHRTRE